MGACEGGPVVSKATGSPGDLIVVMDKSAWEGPAGIAIKDLLSSDVPGLTQPEPVMDISYTEPQNFDRMLQIVRNIMIVEINPSTPPADRDDNSSTSMSAFENGRVSPPARPFLNAFFF